jgi:TetR/AcrR family transcriptional regulator
MSADESLQTEKLIKEKAKILFFQKGFLDATTQEIANEANVNRALIHYYFKSRDQMLDILLEETIIEKKQRVLKALSSNLPFRQKIAKYIDTVVDYGFEYPYLENFIISETARYPDKVKNLCVKYPTKSTDLIREQLQQEIKKKKLAPISAEHFMVNLIALCNYPLLAKSVLKTVHGMTDAGYKKFLLERKKIIYSTIFGEDMPEVDKD